MSILHKLSDLASRYRSYRRRNASGAQLAALPPEIRKDIGWPVVDERGVRNR